MYVHLVIGDDLGDKYLLLNSSSFKILGWPIPGFERRVPSFSGYTEYVRFFFDRVFVFISFLFEFEVETSVTFEADNGCFFSPEKLIIQIRLLQKITCS